MRTDQVAATTPERSILDASSHTAISEPLSASLDLSLVLMPRPSVLNELQVMPEFEDLIVGSVCSELARSQAKWVMALLCNSTQFESIGQPLQLFFWSNVVPLYSDIEFEDILPSQVAKDERVIEVIVSSEEYRWSGLALTDVELDAIFDEGRDA